MDRDHPHLDTWRQACLGDEPIYCAAPEPEHPDDIICPGSDDQLDPAARVAKRLRYEEQALRYLQGKPLHILSASLRGPFETSSGWQNPWLPEPPVKQLGPGPAPSQPVFRPAIKQPTYKNIAKLSEQEDGTTLGADNSLICHLPSPQSNRDLNLFDDSLDSEKRVRIQAWANGLPSTLEKDEFWAPDHGFDQQNHEHSKKRPAGKEWLKTKRPKRTRPNNSRGTTAASTPTPMTAAQSSLRSVSAPPKTVQNKKSTCSTKNASRSFELTTPSSSVDKQRESFQSAELEASTGRHTPTLDDNTLDDSQSGHFNAPMSVTMDISGVDIEPQQQDREPSHTEHTSEELSQHHSQSLVGGSEPAVVGEPSFESCLDNSFHYRARPPKQCIPPTGSNERGPNSAPESIQNEIPESSKHDDTMLISSTSPSEKQKRLGESESEIQEKEASNAWIESTSPELINVGSEKQSSTVEVASSEAGAGPINHVDPIPTNVPKDMSLPQATENLTTSIDLSVAHSCPSMPSVILGSQVDQKTSIDVGERLEISGPLVDEVCTLTEDPMDIDNYSADGMARSLTVVHSPQSPNVVAVQPRLEADASNGEGSPACDQTLRDGADRINNLVIIPISQSELGATEVSNDLPLETTTDATIVEPPTETPIVKVEEVEAGNEESSPHIPAEPTPSIEVQGPWVPDGPPDSHPEVQRIKSEPREVEPSSSLPKSAGGNPSSPRPIGCDIPRISPSQQSPWASEMAEPVLINIQSRGNDTMEETSPEHARWQSPWAETNAIMFPQQPSIQSASTLDSETELRSQADITPSTPVTPAIRSSTPEPCISIKSFANFNTPSPQRSSSRAMFQGLSTGQRRGILINTTPSNPWNSARSRLRVSFAPLPHEDDETNTSPSSKVTRAASPPPQTTLEVDDEEVGDKFRNHFDTVKRRANGEDAPTLSLQHRLLPSFSQQRPMSPAIGAMAAAFQEADACHNKRSRDIDESHRAVQDDGINVPREEHVGNNEAQSPWHVESQGIDDVADVIGNLNEFLDSWDVDTALAQAREVC